MLPSFEALPLRMAFNSVCSAIAGEIAGSSPSQWAKISAITTMAHDILFLVIASSTSSLRERYSIVACTEAAFGLIHIIALRRFNLIASAGIVLLGGLTAWTFVYYCKQSVTAKD